MQTSADYSPWSLLPAPEPRTVAPPVDYFYDNVAKHLVKDTVRIMSNGIPIDLDKVAELESSLDDTLAQAHASLSANPYVSAYLQQRYSRLTAEYIAERQSHCREPSYFARPFKHNDQTHRSYFMHIFAQQQGIAQPSDLLPTGIAKWPATLVKKLSASYPVLVRLLDGSLPQSHATIVAAMSLYCEHRAELHNRQYLQQIADLAIDLPPFNPKSTTQLRELFDLIGIESSSTSKKTGLPSWTRDEIEALNKSSADPDLVSLTQALIDLSFGDIIKTTFIPAFYRCTIAGRLYGNLRLFGAKSFRLTSQDPNMLNLPSTKSIYAKPVKKCFVAPKGYVIYAIDLAALEDRVIASLSRDTAKMAVFTDGLDGHCLNAYGYFPDEVRQHMFVSGDLVTDVKLFRKLQSEGHAELEAIRQKGKPATFGISYGAYPPKVAKTLKIPLSEAESIFNNYHNVLYPGITKYREEYVLPTAKANGKLHLGLGCYLKSDNADKDIRSLANATCQFWSLITLLTVNEMHRRIDQSNADLFTIATIYDSIYYCVREDATTIKWLNDNIVPLITQDWMINQAIPNAAEGAIGRNWADLHRIPNGASLEQINDVLSNL